MFLVQQSISTSNIHLLEGKIQTKKSLRLQNVEQKIIEIHDLYLIFYLYARKL